MTPLISGNVDCIDTKCRQF